jgi:Na+-driven multidrug efflux pump
MDTLHGLRASDIWTAIVIGHVLRCTLGVLRFRQGKWRTIKVDIARPRATA